MPASKSKATVSGRSTSVIVTRQSLVAAATKEKPRSIAATMLLPPA